MATTYARTKQIVRVSLRQVQYQAEGMATSERKQVEDYSGDP